LKSTIDKVYKTKKIANSILSTEANYKTLISNIMSSQQSLKKELPNNLVFLPLYMLGMLKHRVCCKDETDRKLDPDLNNYLRIKMQKLTVDDIMPFIYPRIYPIHEVLVNDAIGQYDENGLVMLPEVNTNTKI
jgi:hypothetical protein